jgi:hypothetical protein
MNAAHSVATPDAPTAPRSSSVPMIGILRLLLWSEAIGGILLAIFLSMAADAVGGRDGASAEEPLRFAAGGAFVLAILALVASRGARRRRPWGWTLAAMLQVIVAVATGVAVLVAEWHPAYLVAFGLAAVVMLVLSTTSVRRALGQA